MDLSALRTELQARGFDFLTDARANQYVNDAYHEICEAAAWPWLETVTSGAAPLTIADVREVLYVLDTAQKVKLESEDLRTITDRDADFSVAGIPNTTGNPECYWLDGNVLRVYPANTQNTLAVRYLEVPDDLSSDDAVPDLPTRYHNLIVDVAEAMVAARDETDERDLATVRSEVDRVVGRMGGVTLNRSLDNPPQQDLNDPKDW